MSDIVSAFDNSGRVIESILSLTLLLLSLFISSILLSLLLLLLLVLLSTVLVVIPVVALVVVGMVESATGAETVDSPLPGIATGHSVVSTVFLGTTFLASTLSGIVRENNNIKYNATTILSAATAAAITSGEAFSISLTATKLTAPPI